MQSGFHSLSSLTRSVLAVTLLPLFLMIHISAHSQMGGGVLGGFTSSQIDGDQWGGYNFWGHHLGGFVDYRLSDRLGLHMEIANSRRGSREAGIGRIVLNYIDVPVFFVLRRELNGREVNGEFGLSGNLLLSAKTGLKPFQFDQTENFRRFSSELHLGAAYYFVKNIGFYGRWTIGLSNLHSDPQLRPWLAIHYFSFGLRVRFL